MLALTGVPFSDDTYFNLSVGCDHRKVAVCFHLAQLEVQFVLLDFGAQHPSNVLPVTPSPKMETPSKDAEPQVSRVDYGESSGTPGWRGMKSGYTGKLTRKQAR